MSIFETQLRQHRRACDERRRYLVQLRLLGERLRADAGRIEGEIAQARAAGSARRVDSLNERRGRLARSMAEIEGQIVTIGDALAAAEQELQRQEAAWRQQSGRPGRAASGGRRR